MKVVLLLLALLGGLCSSLQPGFQYVYRYSGRVATGIIDLRHQFSAAGIQADVTVQVAEDNLVVQFTDVRVGDFHDEVPCDMRAPLPIEYHRMEHGVELLETPFQVLINGSQVMQFLDVPKEPAWITNIRKSVLNIFRISPFLLEHPEDETDSIAHFDFSSDEETMAGRCTNWYSIFKLPVIDAIIYDKNNELEIDDERKGGTPPSGDYTGAKGTKTHGSTKVSKGTRKSTKTKTKTRPAKLILTSTIDKTLWQVTRAIDFENCECLFNMKGHHTPATLDLIGRASTGSYIIRGNKTAMRIERAIVEGTITVFTQDDHQDHLDTFTNQSLELKLVRRTTEPLLTNDYEEHYVFDSWSYEVEQSMADHTVPGIQPTLEQILTGVELTEEDVSAVTTMIWNSIRNLNCRIPRNSTDTQGLVSLMSPIVEAVSILNYHQLEELDNKLNISKDDDCPDGKSDVGWKRNRFILQIAMITAGTEPSITFLLHLIDQVNFTNMYSKTVFKFFNDLPKTIKNPSSIPKLMNVVMQLKWGGLGDTMKSAGLIAFSKLANKMCLHAERRSAHWENTCQQEHICDTAVIIENYIPYLKQGIENEESIFWHRYIYLQALSYLGTPLSIEILRPYILGAKEVSVPFRKDAIFSLAKHNMPLTALGQVMGLLTPVFENIAEDHEVRSIAFITMATWEVNYSWWHRMALLTWHEPSSNLANLISTTIKATAQLKGCEKVSKIASRLEHLVKPAAPASITQSVNVYLLEYLHLAEFESPFTYCWLANTASIIPSEVYLRIFTMTYLGFSQDFSMTLQQVGVGKLLRQVNLLKYFGEAREINADALDIVTEMYEKVKKKLGFEDVDQKKKADFLGRIQDDIFMFIYDEGVLPSFHRTGISSFFNTLHYERLHDSFSTIPTDVGLPFIVRYTVDNGFMITAVNPRDTTSSKTIMEFTFEIEHVNNVEAKTIVPWSKKFAVGTGSEDKTSIFNPFRAIYVINHEDKELQVTFQPLYDDAKVNLIDIHSLPFTVQHGAFPSSVRYNEYKTIKKYDEILYHSTRQLLPAPLGLWVELEWKGDIENPYNIRDVIKGKFNYNRPSLTNWELHIVYDPQASTTYSLTILFMYVSTTKTKPEKPEPDSPLQQFSQSSSDVVQFSQSSSDVVQFSQSSSGAQEFDDIFVDLEVENPTRQRIAKLQEEVIIAAGGHVRSVSAKFSFQGTPSRKYEAVLTWAAGVSSYKRNTKFQFTWIKDVPEGVLGNPHATCLNVHLEKPRLLHFPTVEEMLRTDLQSSIKIDVQDGVSCNLPSVLDIKGAIEISDFQLNEAREMLTKTCGSNAQYHPIDLMTSPIYDHIHIKAHWTEGLPVQLKNLTYHAYDLIRGILFPNIEYDYTIQNPDYVLEIDAHKSLQTQEWTTHFTKPHEVSIVEHFKTPYLFDAIMSPANIKDTLVYDLLNGRKHTACVLTHEKIHTYDGLEIPYSPDDCWNVVTIATSELATGSVEVRFHEGQWEVRITIPTQGLLLELTRSTLKVNGEDFEGNDDRFDIVFVDDGAILTFYHVTDMITKVSEHAVYFLADQTLRSHVHGICGNFNGEKTAEMMGPKGCIYTDAELFIKSWTTPGEGCSGFSYLSLKKPVQAYQDACPTQYYVPTGITYPEMLDDCMTWSYEEKTEGGLKCRALTPTATCKPHCRQVHISSAPILYDCGPATSYRCSKCFLQEYLTVFPGNCIRQ